MLLKLFPPCSLIMPNKNIIFGDWYTEENYVCTLHMYLALTSTINKRTLIMYVHCTCI